MVTAPGIAPRNSPSDWLQEGNQFEVKGVE